VDGWVERTAEKITEKEDEPVGMAAVDTTSQDGEEEEEASVIATSTSKDGAPNENGGGQPKTFHEKLQLREKEETVKKTNAAIQTVEDARSAAANCQGPTGGGAKEKSKGRKEEITGGEGGT
jgi:hypothetical protein